jgi:hypothetical protein
MAQAGRTGKGVAEARDIRAAVRAALVDAKAPKPSASRQEAAEAVEAHKRGEPVDLGGIAVRRALDILARGEDKDACLVLKFLAPAIKSIDAPRPAEPDGAADARDVAQRNRLADAREAAARGDLDATRAALEGLTDMIDFLRLGKAGLK